MDYRGIRSRFPQAEGVSAYETSRPALDVGDFPHCYTGQIVKMTVHGVPLNYATRNGYSYALCKQSDVQVTVRLDKFV